MLVSVARSSVAVARTAAPQASARSAPRRLGTSTDTVRPGSASPASTSAAVSASCDSRRGGTKEPTSISRSPAAWASRSHRILTSVGTTRATDCRPSRRLVSRTTTGRR
jgi:hypothetical protein